MGGGPQGSAGSRREQRKAANRAKLVAAARRAFAQKGYGEVTARDIVRGTDLASGTFYNYFRDKEDVFRAVLDEASERPRALARHVRLAPGTTLEGRVEGAFRAYFEWALSERELFAMMRRNAGAVALVPGLFDAGIAELAQDMQTWQEAGDLPHIDRDYLATAAAGLGFQMATLLVDREPAGVERASRLCTRMFMAGVRALSEQ